jgi:hypothetical protein
MSETTTRPTVQPQAPQAITPNLFNLAGGGLHVSFSTSGIDGQPNFSYQDSLRMLNFRGGEIRIVTVPDLGMVVSVTIAMTVDSGSTTFSLLVPRVNLSAPFSAVPIRTDGITTQHAFSSLPALNQGQRDFYTVTDLDGTASQVNF